ncbi:hypothetical protein Poly24_23470 [Rosistilla carotiformis]|uniref:Uncharacterized protein n=1 Tax=Rosistilla carotiformis TaxID=2528017 RepID=A0A518JSX6_9BACT|nr:hypothetical protein Poly24_23470 [Rosistilla carotiformis]
MKSFLDTTPPNYRVLFIVFSICTVLGTASLIVSELFMPANPGGDRGRFAMYRYVGAATFCWLSLSLWSWHKMQRPRMEK